MSKVDTTAMRSLAHHALASGHTETHAHLTAAADILDQCRVQGYLDEQGQVRKVRYWTDVPRGLDLAIHGNAESIGPFVIQANTGETVMLLAAQGTKEKP